MRLRTSIESVDDVEAGDADFSVGGRKVAGEHFHGRAFARAVRAEKPDDFALVDVKADALDGAESGIGFGEIFDFDHKTEWRDRKSKRHA